MSSKLRSLFVNLSLLAVSTFLALLIVEVIVRISKTPAIIQTHQQLFVEHDPLLGWRKIPNATGVHATSEYTIEEQFNSRGLRGPEYPYEKSNGEYRILILGDSFAEGYTVPFDELFSEVLKRSLVHPNKRVEVINAGTGGYSTDQEVIFFAMYGKKYTPDLTILLFYQNDVWYNGQARYWRGFKPRFEFLENGDLSLSGVPVPLPGRSNAEDSGFRRLKRWLRTNLHTYQLVSESVKSSAALNAMAVKAGLVDKSESDFVPEEFRVFEKGCSQRLAELWRLTKALLLRLKDDTASVGSRLLIFYVPFRASIYYAEWEQMKREYGMKEGNWAPELPGVVLQNICERHGLECLDPTELFKRTRERLYFVEDGHWNPVGHRTVGETLAGYIATHVLDE
jgi:hypothetical protein